MFKYDIHVHSSGTSHCGHSTACEMVDAALNSGFSGFVLTNHFYNGNTLLDRKSPWEDFVEVYANEYFDAKEYGEQKGIKVFFGIEEMYDVGKEVLVYGTVDKSDGDVIVRAEVFPNYDALKEQLGEITEDGIKDAIKACIENVNDKMPTYKRVKRFKLREEEFEKTSTRKIKRAGGSIREEDEE